MSLQIETGAKPRPRLVLWYGVPGVGKTTGANTFPQAITFDLNDGSNDLDCTRVPSEAFQTLEDLYANIDAVGGGDYDYKTLIIDSVDEIERLIFDYVCLKNNAESLEDIGYGKGYVFAVNEWLVLLAKLRGLLRAGKMVILIGHVEVVRFDDPAHESYSRYQPKVDKRVLPILMDKCDEVLFHQYKTLTKEQVKAFDKQKFRAVGTGERIWKCQERPAWAAKNRLGMPEECNADWATYKSFAYPKKTEGTENS